MIVQFEFSNFRSFKDKQTFSLLSSARSKKKRELEDNLIPLDTNSNLLKSAVVYGANSSGKSNFIKAIEQFKRLVLLSNSLVDSQPLVTETFLFDKGIREKPIRLEMILWIDGQYYQYGFIYSKDSIEEEWLYLKKKRVSKVFHRYGQNLDDIGDSYKILRDDNFKKTIHTKSLILSRGASFNEEICILLYSNIQKLNCISGINDFMYQGFTIQKLKNKKDKANILNLIRNADMGIDDLELTKREGINFNIELKENSILQTNKGFVDELNTVRFMDDGTKLEIPFMLHESEGTQKFFHLTGPILDTLENGNILVVDELDTKLHPLLTRKIIELFHNSITNPKNAQIIFATHDTNLLDKELFRRDQIWFTEKDKSGASQLYPLSDFKIRNDMNLEKNYIAGKYGAIPYLRNISSFLESNS